MIACLDFVLTFFSLGREAQCEVFVCLDFVLTFFPLAVKLTSPQMGRQFFKNVEFSITFPLKQFINNTLIFHPLFCLAVLFDALVCMIKQSSAVPFSFYLACFVIEFCA